MAWTMKIRQELACLLKQRAVPLTMFMEENLCLC